MSNSSQPQKTFRAGRFLSSLLAASLTMLVCGGFSVVFADDATAASNLSKLEDKFFQHDFSKDQAAERVERLEKLIYGEARSGSTEERLSKLMTLVPDLDAKPAETAPPAPDKALKEPAAAPDIQRPPRTMKTANPLPDSSADEPVANANSYPAVTAMEKKLLGRDFVGESLGKRLDRLEIKAYGKTSASEDFQERVDRLRSSTGVDVARAKPLNSEWADEEEDPATAGNEGVQPFTGIGADDPAGQRNYRKQQSSFARPRPSYDPYAGTGTFGAGGSIPAPGGSSGSFGMGGSDRGGLSRKSEIGSGMPPSAPDFSRQGGGSAPIPAPAMGVSQQISLLEREVFRRTYEKETILNRLSRLESTVFPQDKSASEKSLPERMNRLLAAVPISQANSVSDAPVAPKRRRDPDFPDLDFNSPGTLSTQASKPQGQNGGGLSRIINGLGSMISGGGSMGGYPGGYTGSYSTTPGHLVTDPSTGLLLDQYTGTLIDPMTGAVVSRRTVGYPTYGGFNSGLSPMAPYGGVGFGFGGSGMRIGGWP